MAHEIESMMFVGQTPWHKHGVRCDQDITTGQAMITSGLNWKVESVPVMTTDGIECKEWRAIRRETDASVFAIMLSTYTPLQNDESFSFFDPFLAAGEARLETAGSLRGGARVWILAKLNRDPMVIKGNDTVEKYILLSNSHDGTLAVRVGFTPVRVVCANTLAMSHSHHASKLIKIRHTKNVQVNLEAIRETMNAANAAFEATAEQYRALAATEINSADLAKYIDVVFETKSSKVETEDQMIGRLLGESTDQMQDRLLGRKSRVHEPITELFEAGKGQDMAGARGTLWGAYNAVTEYVSHVRGTDASKRLDSTWFGQGAQVNQRALATATAMVGHRT